MYERHRGWARKDGLKPSDVFRRNFYGAFVEDEVGVAFRAMILSRSRHIFDEGSHPLEAGLVERLEDVEGGEQERT